MKQALEKVLAGDGSGGKPIRVDVEALWKKASDGKEGDGTKKSYDPQETLDDMGEFAVISAWARKKGRKG